MYHTRNNIFFTTFIGYFKNIILEHNTMAKSKDSKKNVKKEAALSPKEKKAAKLAKKATRQ
jgi:hypothetical protein